MKYDYDNKKRVALSTKTWKRLKRIKKWMKFTNTDKLLNVILDDWEYGIKSGEGV